jgi:SAM-dependent methyltransferase
MVKNHFLEQEAAEDYDLYRPYFHPLVFSRLSQLTTRTGFERGLDVGCGTGQSTQAMAAVSKAVIGLDASVSMLRQARHRGFPCIQGSAERLPLADGEFDLVGIGLAFHWFDRFAVLHEARRVLKSRGWLLIFNSWFAGVMQENADFGNWQKAYLQRFPTPPRHSSPLADDVIRAARFREVASERFAHEHEYTREQLVGYLKTQTNVITAVACGTESDKAVTNWLMSTLEPVFVTPTGTFGYGGLLSLYEAIG